jgi:hypothetical protein
MFFKGHGDFMKKLKKSTLNKISMSKKFRGFVEVCPVAEFRSWEKDMSSHKLPAHRFVDFSVLI